MPSSATATNLKLNLLKERVYDLLLLTSAHALPRLLKAKLKSGKILYLSFLLVTPCLNQL